MEPRSLTRIKALEDKAANAFDKRTDILPVELGGTGAQTPEEAMDNLGLAEWRANMELTNPKRIRQAVLRGRQKDGYPAYLVGPEFLNMEHEDGVYHTRRGTVSVSSEYGAKYRGTKPLRNQVVFQSEGWLTANTVTAGWWQYDFADGPHVLCGLFMGNRASGQTFWPKKWQLLGWNEGTQEWETICERENDQQLTGHASNLKERGRMYWFTENTEAYSRVRINIDENHGGAYSQISAIRFYEAVIPGQHQYDTAIYATEDEPFEATIACGQQVDTETGHVRDADVVVRLTDHVHLDTTNLAEMSRNYIYLAPYDRYFRETGGLTGWYNSLRHVFLHGNKEKNFVVLASTQKVHYGSLEELKAQTLGLLYCEHTEDYDPVTNGQFEHNKGALEYPLQFSNMRVTTSEPVYGLPSSYKFSNGSSNFIGPNTSLSELAFPSSHKHPYSNECTVEMGFKWEGPSPDAADSYYVLFDTSAAGAGWLIAYHNRKKCFAVHHNSNKFYYCAPFNAADNAWHWISVSIRESNLWLHIDGKCLLAVDDFLQQAPGQRQWMIGEFIGSPTYPWYGYVNCFRYTLGTARYQGDDYEAPRPDGFTGGEFTSLIPNATLYYSEAIGCVQVFYGDAVLHDLPLLPIGHIDTGWKEHLLTDQPRGTATNMQSKYLMQEGFGQSDSNNTSQTAVSLFNFGESGANPWQSTADATIEHEVRFVLDGPMSFGRLRFCNTTLEWTKYPVLFEFGCFDEWTEDVSGEDGTVTQEIRRSYYPLLTQDTFVDDGGFVNAIPAATAGSHHIQAYKTWYPNSSHSTHYYLKFLPKADVPFYGAVGNTAARIMLTLENGKPEVLERSSYVLGDSWESGPIPLGVGTDAEIPVPFGNLPFEVDGLVEEEADFQLKRRKLGQQGYNHGSNDSNLNSGEIVYAGKDSVTICTAANYLSPYFGRWNSTAVAASSVRANYYLKLKRSF